MRCSAAFGDGRPSSPPSLQRSILEPPRWQRLAFLGMIARSKRGRRLLSSAFQQLSPKRIILRSKARITLQPPGEAESLPLPCLTFAVSQDDTSGTRANPGSTRAIVLAVRHWQSPLFENSKHSGELRMNCKSLLTSALTACLLFACT